MGPILAMTHPKWDPVCAPCAARVHFSHDPMQALYEAFCVWLVNTP